jgi:hypothetical protein
MRAEDGQISRRQDAQRHGNAGRAGGGGGNGRLPTMPLPQQRDGHANGAGEQQGNSVDGAKGGHQTTGQAGHEGEFHAARLLDEA